MRLASLHTYPVKGCYRLDHRTAVVEPWGLAGDRRWMVVEPDGTFLSQRSTPALTQVRPAPAPGGLVLRAPGRPDLPDLEVAEPVGAAGLAGSGPAEPVGAAGLAEPAPAGSAPKLLDVTVHRTTVAAAPAGAAADAWFTAVLGRPARLVWLDDPTRRPVNPLVGTPTDRVSFADGYPVTLANQASLDALNDWLAEEGSPEGPLPMNRFRPNLVVSGAAPWAEDDWTGRLRVGEVTFRVAKPAGRCVVTTTDQETGERGREPLPVLGRHRNVDQMLLFAIHLIPDAPGTIAVGDPVTPTR
ncbi:MAG TPA: MOSC N-terminal beta barrel domain-containing protein [Pilimelia sp.]|nr:MOSC N-terminal beta barrel domain-containing protein [Pilimelia sp.]